MHFKLFYKQYDFKSNLSAIKQFKEATGKDLWSTLLRYMVQFINDDKQGLSIGDRLANLGDLLDFTESAQLFYCIAKQSNSVITLDEIEDAMFHAGMLPNTKDSDLCEPYPFVMFMIANDVHKYHSELSEEKKP